MREHLLPTAGSRIVREPTNRKETNVYKDNFQAQRLLGHSDPRVTMSIYTQVLDNEIDEVGLLLSKAAGF
jgi:integrase